MDLFLFLPLTWTWIRFFPESIFYWSLVPSVDEFASGGPDPVVIILVGASGFFLQYILLSFIPNLVVGNVLDLGDRVKECPIREHALFHGFDCYGFIQPLNLEARLIEPSDILPQGLGYLLFDRVQVRRTFFSGFAGHKVRRKGFCELFE